ACTYKGVTFRFDSDVTRAPSLLAPFDRIVIATGADYRFGLGPLATRLLDWGAGRWPGVDRLLSLAAVRDWFYYQGREATGARFMRLVKPGQIAVVIGDAARPGKSKAAIASAFGAALVGGSAIIGARSRAPNGDAMAQRLREPGAHYPRKWTHQRTGRTELGFRRRYRAGGARQACSWLRSSSRSRLRLRSR